MEIKHYPQVAETLYKDVLPNGLSVYYLPKPDYNKTYGLFTTNFGSLDTTFVPRGKSEMTDFPEGIAHFLEHKLFEKEDGDAMNFFSALGANSNAFTSFTRTSYLFSTMENSDENVSLLLDFVQEPYFTEASVAKEQGIITQEIQMYQDDADFRLFFGLLQNLYPDSPLASDIAGTPRSIGQITADALYENYQTFYHPSNMNLFVTGPFDVEKMAELVRDNQAQKSFPKTEPITRAAFSAAAPIASNKMAFDVTIPKLALGFRGYDRLPSDSLLRFEYKMAVQLMLTMIFGNTSSRYESLYNEGLIDDSFGFDFEVAPQYHFASITSDTIYPIKLAKILRDTLKSYKIESDFNSEHLTILKKEMLGDYYKSLNSLEFIANQFSSNLFEGVTFFDFPMILSSLTLEKIIQHADKFVSQMQTTDFVMNPK
ncbi:EF-P 5-aminopentanol modification-associated protein YfmH [Lactococcus insecticola]|uniref:Protease n=1 Tax=Pseudolactococcus insecticola TaxID=2709158 RepID=A0A6A0B6R5_9LACT|nr:pitrilysin family protein [Lactococcus insecticola]GFH41030.1 protease [Lactococcus insecticola]